MLIRSFRGGQATIAHYFYAISYYIIAVTGGGCFERTKISFIPFQGRIQRSAAITYPFEEQPNSTTHRSLRNSSTTQKVSKMRKKVKLLQCPSLKLRLNSLTQWQRFKKGAKLKKKSLLKTVQTKTLPCSQNCYQIRIQQHY